MRTSNIVSTTNVVAIGLSGLAAAMGIGRFAFTPLLPLMQNASGLTLTEGNWLAIANYLGYLAGALLTFVRASIPGPLARLGLITVAVSTAAMALTTGFAAWLALRFVSGAGSAFVLVGVSSWALAHLAAGGAQRAAGAVFSGVGTGIFVTGIVALAGGVAGSDPALIWLLLGVLCTIVTATSWRALSIAAAAAALAPHQRPDAPLGRDEWILVACYGIFGFGYIIPATFLPASARALINDPAVFGWTWPVFGLAAAVSTAAVSTVFARTPPRRVAMWSLVVMAAGVIAPVIQSSVASLVVSALCVGSTFMVMTMAGVQEARRIAAGSPTKLVAALTAAFALGQIAGPIVVGLGRATANAVALTSIAASALLILSAIVLGVTGAASSVENRMQRKEIP
jgi:MFS family permease